MRRISKAFGIIAIAALLLTSCSKGLDTSTPYTPSQIAQAIISAQAGLSSLQPLLPGDDNYADYLTDIYQLDAGAIKDGIICYSNGMAANEIAVFQLVGDSAASEAKETLEKYKERRTDAFMGYAPLQAAILENGIVVAHGGYAALLICEDAQNAQAIFMACFSGEPPVINGDIWSALPENTENSQENEPEQADKIPISPFFKDETAGGAANHEEAKDETNNDKTADEGSADERNSDEGSNDEISAAEETDDDMAANGNADSDNIGDDESTGDKAAIEETSKAEQVDDEAPGGDHGNAPAPDDAEAIEGAVDSAEANVETNGQEDGYDPAAILKVWRSGDAAGLSEKNKKILEACTEVIAYTTNSSMDIYEKELAIHDWIIAWVSYDEESISNSPFAKPDPDNDNPYGALYGKKAICSGYTSTFQLFMDMLGIECLTVNGIYTATGEEHAWNMVRIDGEWYCVDTTWDDPIGGFQTNAMKHRYFNVTTEFMLETRHQWDESLTPIADAGKLYMG